MIQVQKIPTQVLLLPSFVNLFLSNQILPCSSNEPTNQRQLVIVCIRICPDVRLLKLLAEPSLFLITIIIIIQIGYNLSYLHRFKFSILPGQNYLFEI